MLTDPDTSSPEAPVQQPPSPEPVMRVAAGFMAAKHLFAASELGLFEALGDGPTSLDGLTARTGLTPRAARISADAMVALGLLERHGDRYQNSPAAAAFLAGPSPFDLRAFLRFWDKISYPAWTNLARALAVGPSVEIFDLDHSLQQVASEGIEAITAGPAGAFAETVDFSSHHRLLDVGGGTGSWSMAAVRRHPHLEATVFELPTVADLARQRLKGEFGARIAVVAGDFMADELPSGHDVCLLANVVHYWSPEENRELLTRIRGAVVPGCRLLVADFWTDSSHTEPLMAALMAGEFAVHIRHGDVYSVEEMETWLAATGWALADHRPLAGPFSLVAADAI